MKLVALIAVVSLAGCFDKTRNESVKASNEGAKAYGQKQYETAIERYEKATQKWRDNHVAWYGLAGAHMGKKDFKSAADALEQAVNIMPKQAMYQMMLGVALYEKTVAQAREDQARREDKKPEEIEPDLTTVNFESAIQHLQEAVKLNKDLWRAHYYLGKIYRDQGESKKAAEAFNASVSLAPTDPNPWVALGELYRLWDYTDQAIQVAEQGVAVVPGDNEKSDLWYVVGMGYDDKGNHGKAIEAYTKALESRSDNHKAKFQRGQAYFRAGDYTEAKQDLQEFSKSGGKSVEFAKQQASKMLMDIASKSAGGSMPSERLSPEEMVKRAKKG